MATCAVCWDEIPLDRMVQCNAEPALDQKCHQFCLPCVRRYAASEVATGKPQLACMVSGDGCKAVFTQPQMDRFLDENSQARLDLNGRRAAMRAAGADLGSLEICPFCFVQADEVVAVEDAPELACQNPKCGIVSCRHCRNHAHTPKTCEEVGGRTDGPSSMSLEEQLRDMVSEAMVRKCNECGTRYVKGHGCNKVVCPVCKTSQCYLCGKTLDKTTAPYSHFDNPWSEDSTKCAIHKKTTEIYGDAVVAAARELRKKAVKERSGELDDEALDDEIFEAVKKLLNDAPKDHQDPFIRFHGDDPFALDADVYENGFYDDEFDDEFNEEDGEGDFLDDDDQDLIQEGWALRGGDVEAAVPGPGFPDKLVNDRVPYAPATLPPRPPAPVPVAQPAPIHPLPLGPTRATMGQALPDSGNPAYAPAQGLPPRPPIQTAAAHPQPLQEQPGQYPNLPPRPAPPTISRFERGLQQLRQPGQPVIPYDPGLMDRIFDQVRAARQQQNQNAQLPPRPPMRAEAAHPQPQQQQPARRHPQLPPRPPLPQIRAQRRPQQPTNPQLPLPTFNPRRYPFDATRPPTLQGLTPFNPRLRDEPDPPLVGPFNPGLMNQPRKQRKRKRDEDPEEGE
ncbi:hypothetical protein B0H66DRAFT_623415 [Apodospora peruviana]|uniref:RING-type domain-containing protein n=1 Tax=Apodospora peruviana TaxID=516989 RepID=A0AAE0M548_9PEZI|nr:hypothetical protein B0H66DRAFT_623415 [Apodospora peruviana]